jgi:cytochrome d ubiquinol oxidase subunit I
VLSNPVFIWGYVHVLLASLVTGAAVMLAVSAWHLRKGSDADIFRRATSLSLMVLVPASLLALMVGSHLGVVETSYQPMKIAAAEGQWTTCQPCSFSLFQIGGGNDDHTPTQIIEVPHLLSLLATGTWNGKVVGLDPLNTQYQQKYGPGYYVPNVFVQYWGMRVMAYTATLVFLLSVWGAWLVRRKKVATSKWFLRAAIWAVALPFLMNTAGWILTESGRQPWIVQGLQLTAKGVSPSVGASWIAISLGVFLVLYGVLAVVDWVLMIRYSRRELGAVPDLDDEGMPVHAEAMSY